MTFDARVGISNDINNACLQIDLDLLDFSIKCHNAIEVRRNLAGLIHLREPVRNHLGTYRWPARTADLHCQHHRSDDYWQKPSATRILKSKVAGTSQGSGQERPNEKVCD